MPGQVALRAFAFDLDETLVDANDAHDEATRVVLAARGAEWRHVRRSLPDCTGLNTPDYLGVVCRTAGIAETLQEILAERSAAFEAALAREAPPPLPGALEALRSCRGLGPVALVSNGARRDVHATLRALGVSDAFKLVLSAEDVSRPKPDPFPYVEAARRLDVSPREMLVFEDSPRGVDAAVGAGCRVVAVPNVRSTRPEAVKHAHAVLGSLTEALPVERLIARLHRE